MLRLMACRFGCESELMNLRRKLIDTMSHHEIPAAGSKTVAGTDRSWTTARVEVARGVSILELSS